MPEFEDAKGTSIDGVVIEGHSGVTAKPVTGTVAHATTGTVVVETADFPVVPGLGLGMANHGFGSSGSASAGGSGDASKVDTVAIRGVAESGTAHVHTIDEIIGEMQQDMAASEGSWVGEAGSWYRDVFVTGSSKCRKALEEYVLFASELVSYADEYEAADSRAQQAADDVEIPSM